MLHQGTFGAVEIRACSSIIMDLESVALVDLMFRF